MALYSQLSNSPFWYVDAGMNYVVGPDWREQWDVVIVSAGKPAFYTEDNRPFREVGVETGKVKFQQVRCIKICNMPICRHQVKKNFVLHIV